MISYCKKGEAITISIFDDDECTIPHETEWSSNVFSCVDGGCCHYSSVDFVIGDDDGNGVALAMTYSTDILAQTGSPYGPDDSDSATSAKASALALVLLLAAWN